jgi:hypothetical protein
MWWEYIIIALVLIAGIYAFKQFVGFETRVLSRKTTRKAEDMYGNYADRGRRARRDTTRHDAERADGQNGPSDQL